MEKKSKGKRKIQIVIVSIFLVAGMGYIGYGMVVDYMIERMFEQQVEAMLRESQQQASTSASKDEMPEIEQSANEQATGELVLSEEALNEEATTEAAQSETGAGNQVQDTDKEEIKAESEVSQAEDTSVHTEETQEKTPEKQPEGADQPVGVGTTNQEVVESATAPTQMSDEEFEELVDQKVAEVTSQVTTRDKNGMSSLIFSNLSMGQIEYLARLMLDGVTPEDLAIAKSIALESFTGEALEEVQAYYEKYNHLIK